MKLLLLSLLLLVAGMMAGCGAIMEPQASPPLATEDAGPRPGNARAVVAAWANEHYKFWPEHPFTAEELVVSEPMKVAVKMPIWFPIGHPVGWAVILGPENERLAGSIEEPCTRLIINRDQVIFVESRNYPFEAGP